MAPTDATLMRRLLGHLPTGVTVLTARTEDEPVGMVANSVTSVSLDPPLMLVCPAKSSTTWPSIRAARGFCINVMAGHHEDVCRRFAVKGARDRFDDVSWHVRRGAPALDDAVAWIDCAIRDEHDAGDHTIVVADVMGIEAAEEVEPLVFFRGRYGTFAG
jgi:3-hydroxy-9,10-secoandrosta-1,3,5(10)-triene-9,17-dione monooxygenase reductase component